MTVAAARISGRAVPSLGWIALALFALLTFLPAFATLPVVDRDEARFAQASRQMVESRDFVDIRFQDEARHKKPVGIYWLQSGAVLASMQGPEADLWIYRLPSLAGALLAVLLVAVVGAPLFGTGPALLAAAVFAGGLVIGGEARIAKTDAALLATILASQAVLARLYLRQAAGHGLAYAFWLSVAAGILIKGPIGPMVPLFTAATLAILDRRADWLRPLWSLWPIVVALLVTVPWFVAITLRSDGAFWLGSVGTDLLPKIASGQEGKGAPPGSYLLMLFFTFWPATPLLLLALPAIWRARREPATRFCLAWALPVWLLYEAIPTKLLHYTLPVFPALALLTVGHLPAALTSARNWLKGLAALAILPGLAFGAVILTYAATTNAGPAPLLLAGAGLAGAIVAIAVGLRAFAGNEPWRLAASFAAAGAILYGGLFSAVARMPVLWPTDAAIASAKEIAAAQGCDRPRLTGWGYTEPSLVWRGGRETRLLPAAASADAIQPGACQVVVRAIDADSAATPPPAGCRSAAKVEGLAIGAGKYVRLDILDCRGLP
ncbi:ArnT family glycosyltransferase [Tabrizicola sp.]|uniref:ArnT family glycosyltransferase n=1 Tax=Tabrizicola sp. TaxID=2005166 RepID=UPI003F29F9B0